MHIYILYFIDTKMLLIVTYSINIKAFIRKCKHCIKNATFYKIYSGFRHHKNSEVPYEGVCGDGIDRLLTDQMWRLAD